MARYELLNNVDHGDLRIIIERAAEFGDNLWHTATFPSEFRNVQRHYPVFFTRQPDSGEYQAVAMFGVEEGENLFLDQQGWKAGYIPLNILRMPFLIGFQDQQQSGQQNREPVITVDMDSPRVNRQRGERVFLEQGGNSPYVEQVSSILKVLHEGMQRSKPFFDTLEQMNLLESFVVDVQLNDGSEHRLAGFHTINADALRTLDAGQLADLNKRGYLEAIYMVIASMSHLPELIEKKNQRLQAAATRG
jgi:hypothetical protein